MGSSPTLGTTNAIDLTKGFVHINRLKNGRDGTHPLSGREIRALLRLKREYPDTPHVFVSERGGPMTSSNVRKMLTRAGEGLGMPVHPYMLRHGCGFKLANQGIDTRSIQAFGPLEHRIDCDLHRDRTATIQRILEGLID